VAETGQPYAFTGDDPLNSTDPLGLAKGGPQNKTSKEFEEYSNAELLKLYKSLKGRLAKEQAELKQKLQTELKARKLRGSSGGGGPIKMVAVTPSAELGPAQRTLEVPVSDLLNPTVSVSFQLNPPPAPALGLLGLILVGGTVALAAG
jgi:hypothetical protein